VGAFVKARPDTETRPHCPGRRPRESPSKEISSSTACSIAKGDWQTGVVLGLELESPGGGRVLYEHRGALAQRLEIRCAPLSSHPTV
jgi:hypothetical protein